ncbi:TrmH family RNA methyltransferase [Weeksella virosa]|nr:RNA methyltransferase [Weeksella virosa]MDK7675662.1 RNA methyltransferase [Weeksella virosa]SUP53672.1 Putative TrmH family tRNA/rRNA methyltransferase [Weeksella virosa]VEH62878.1 Putative TrmH family tRNA/rRNA methyltransferase [Weeksella virosa]
MKIITSLGSKKYRQKYNLFVVEGVKNVKEVLKSNITVKELYTTNQNFDAKGNLPVHYLSPNELKKISFLSTPNECLAVCEIPPQRSIAPVKGLTLVLDTINDPGNLGTIIRLADWFGITQIICSKESVDVYNPKVIMSTMGSFARVAVHYTDILEVIENYKYPILGAFMEGESIFQFPFPENAMLVMGSEAHGISKAVEDKITNKISIPAIGKQTESLNVAMATSIIVGEVFSQKMR